MDENKLQTQIDDINGKLDIILKEIDLQRRYRSSLEDLGDDVMRVGEDVYHNAILELEEFNDSFEPKDLMLLGKQMLRNVKNFQEMFAQLESARDFMADFNTIQGDMFNGMLLKLDEMDRKGYFDLMKETQTTLDTLVASFSVDDLKRVNEMIPVLVTIVKRMSDPELLKKVDKAVAVFEQSSFDSTAKASTVGLIRDMTSPEVKKGMNFMLGVFRNVVREYDMN